MDEELGGFPSRRRKGGNRNVLCLKCGYIGDLEEFDLEIRDQKAGFSIEEIIERAWKRPTNQNCPKCFNIMIETIIKEQR